MTVDVDINLYNVQEIQHALLACQLYRRWVSNLVKADRPTPTKDDADRTLRNFAGDDRIYNLAIYLMRGCAL